MNRKTVDLSLVKNVIMDEADEMLNMGFTDSINAILAEVRRTATCCSSRPPCRKRSPTSRRST